jgi:hypothetical protein
MLIEGSVHPSLPYRSERSSTSTHRQSVREYVQASEALLKIDELTVAELEVVQDMLNRISEKLLNSGNDGTR